jgi:hypothetical protein
MMARLADLSWGKFTAFITTLGNAGLTAEMAVAVSNSPELARSLVFMLQRRIDGSWSEGSYFVPRVSWLSVAPNVQIKRSSDGVGIEVRVSEPHDGPKSLSINVLRVHAIVLKSLRDNGIHNLGDLVTWEAGELLSLRGCGINDLNIIRENLRSYGLHILGENND